jgi:hypothetical protein
MPDIINPQAVKFASEKIRLAADLLAQLDNFATATVNQWNALGGAALIPNTADVIADGAVADGRPILTGAKANSIMTRLNELRSTNATTGLAMGASGVRDTVLQVAVNVIR